MPTCAGGGGYLRLAVQNTCPSLREHLAIDAQHRGARSTKHGVSHRAAAHALSTRRDEGLILSVRGKGYYVTARASGL